MAVDWNEVNRLIVQSKLERLEKFFKLLEEPEETEEPTEE